MVERANVVAVGLGGAMVLGVAGLFFATHYQALLHPGPGGQAETAAPELSTAVNIPTVEEMCKAVGATSENMASCQEQENEAGEFVIAWMGLNGFLVNGAIDAAQIELAASLGPDPTSPLINPDPSLTDPSLADPSLGGQGSEPNIDPATGLPVDQTFESPAQIAMYCLNNSMDWLQMHDCISRYDPSTRFNGGF